MSQNPGAEALVHTLKLNGVDTVFGRIKAEQKSGCDEPCSSIDFGQSDHARSTDADGVKPWSVNDAADLGGAVSTTIESPSPNLIAIISPPLWEVRTPVSKWVV